MDRDRPDELSLLQAAIWEQLQQAVELKTHPWRTPVLSTRDGDGVDARTVVLRDANATARRLMFYTDARSPKVAQLRAQPMASLVCWSAPLGWQLRLRCRLQVSTDGLAVSSRWAQLRISRSAQDYMAPIAPGTPVDAPQRPELGERSHFALVYAEVAAMDWLALDADKGHRRALFDAQGGRWLAP